MRASNSMTVEQYRASLGIAKKGGKPKHNKYNNRKTIIDGIKFDSLLEARRYTQLLALKRGGLIKDLVLQPVFNIEVNGKKICKYIADFKYYDTKLGTTIIEDAKGMKTDVYKLKKKLVEALYNIKIIEITK